MLTIGELRLLRKIAGKNKIIIEIESYKGHTAMKLGKYNKVRAIDPFIGFYNNKNDGASIKIGENRKEIITIFKKNIQNRNVIWLEEKSEEVLKRWNSYVDGIFIDAEHTYKAIKKDAEWIKWVKGGGFIAFHGVHESYPGVKRFVEEKIIPKYKYIGKCDSLYISQK